MSEQKVYFKAKLNDKSANPGMEIIFYPPEFKAYDKLDLMTMERIPLKDMTWLN